MTGVCLHPSSVDPPTQDNDWIEAGWVDGLMAESRKAAKEGE